MPSAGRPFTEALITRLVARGVLIAPITLHTGVSSPERAEGPFPEYYDVPGGDRERSCRPSREGAGASSPSARRSCVRSRRWPSRTSGRFAGARGWTDLRITPERGVWLVDGLITGWHEPEASHLEMLEALAGRELLERCYDAALGHGYLWHEFGDSHLILP